MKNDTLFLRQIHPALIQSGHISEQAFFTSQAFTPTKKDAGKLSVYHGELFTPSSAFEHYTECLNLHSAGVVAVTAAECSSEGRSVIEDNDPFEGHAHIDYTGLTNGETRKVAKVLRDFAVQRGWLHQRQDV